MSTILIVCASVMFYGCMIGATYSLLVNKFDCDESKPEPTFWSLCWPITVTFGVVFYFPVVLGFRVLSKILKKDTSKPQTF